MTRSIIRLAIAAALCASPAAAVIRFDRIEAAPDTLRLSPPDLNTFRTSLRAGGDLSTAGTYLFSASVVVPILAGAASNLGVGNDGVYRAIGNGCAIGSQLGFAAMAVGNLIASRASRLDTSADYALNSRLVPTLGLFVSTWASAAVANNLIGCRDDREGCGDPIHLLLPMAAELILAPILRIRYNRAAEHLGNLRLVPTPRGATLSLVF